jgi:hypothetical protein
MTYHPDYLYTLYSLQRRFIGLTTMLARGKSIEFVYNAQQFSMSNK